MGDDVEDMSANEITESLRAIMHVLGLQEWAGRLNQAGLRTTASLADVSSADGLPEEIPILARKKLVDYFGMGTRSPPSSMPLTAPRESNFGRPWSSYSSVARFSARIFFFPSTLVFL